jgi:hypothetical protein
MNKIFFLLLYVLMSLYGSSQVDTSVNSVNKVDSFLMHQKGLVGKLARNLMTDKPSSPGAPVRKDLLFNRYKGKIIRSVTIRRLDFGTPINDTSRRFETTFTRWANDLHHKTREEVVRKNLFFKKGEKLVPYLIADNERYLRDLPYLNDADIRVVYVDRDSVDIIVLTKDVLSLGGSFRLHNTTKVSVTLSEDNIAGTGQELLFRTLFENKRNPKFGYGGEFTSRNIGGSFMDWYGGYTTYNKNFTSGIQNEEMLYTGINRPLVNPYVKFTYSATAAWHETNANYLTDTLYETNTRYRYYNYDGWIGWNTGAFKLSSDVNKDNRARTLLGLRYLQQKFSNVPTKYETQYSYQYADIKAILGSVTIFRQDYYKVHNVLGFGRNEDIPEGADLSLITGWTKKAGVDRPYIGLDIQRYFFTARESYFNYVMKADGFLRNKQLEDINLLFNVDYFTRLLHMGKRWSERNFISAGISHQVGRVLDEPLFLQSDFGVREWRSDTMIAGDTRITLKAESVFFTPWELAKFRFAPFVFTHLNLFTPVEEKFSRSTWYNSIGAGVRTRNESLVFQTMEFRAYYFPRRNFLGDHWRLEINTNVRFTYSHLFEKKPSFVNINGM